MIYMKFKTAIDTEFSILNRIKGRTERTYLERFR